MRKKRQLPERRILASIRRCKGHCKRISEDLHIDYHKALALKKDPLYKPLFEKIGIVKNGPQPDTEINTLASLGIDRVIKAVMASGGIASKVAKKLKVSYMTVYNWKSIPEIAAAFQLAVESNLDLAEDKLITNMKARDDTALIFYLKCKGHKRGYIETQRNVQMTQDEYERMKEDEIESKLTALQRSVAAAENRVAQITE